MRVLAFALVAAALLLVPGAAATPTGLKLLARDNVKLSLLYEDRSTPFFQPLSAVNTGELGFSGDGRLISIGGDIVSRNAKLPTKYLVWSPVGERAAWVTTSGSVMLWTPDGTTQIEPKSWGADWHFHENGLAWSPDGESLAIGRGSQVYVWNNGTASRVAGTKSAVLAVPFAWRDNDVLWWAWSGSSSIAADGVFLFEGARQLGATLMYRDYTATCGSHVAFTEGTDRYSTDAKSMAFDGQIVAGGPQGSYTQPACTASGRLVAAVSRNNVPHLTSETHRSLWQLLPARKQLTKPPRGWSDENPHVYDNGDVLFVRTRTTFAKQNVTQTGHVMLLSGGKLTQLATIGFTENQLSNAFPIEYYGHYDWTHQLAVWP